MQGVGAKITIHGTREKILFLFLVLMVLVRSSQGVLEFEMCLHGKFTPKTGSVWQPTCLHAAV